MIIQVKVYPSSGREEIIKLNDDSYKVYLKKPAEDIDNCISYMTFYMQFSICITANDCNLNNAVIHNKANIELLKLLRRHAKKSPEIFGALKTKGFYGFGVEAKIIKGLTSRNKIIRIGD